MGPFHWDFEEAAQGAWVWDALHRRFRSPSVSTVSSDDGLGDERINFKGIPLSQSPYHEGFPYSYEFERRDTYLGRLYAEVEDMLESPDFSLRELNHESGLSIPFPDLKIQEDSHVSKEVMDIYWRQNKESYLRKQYQINVFMELNPASFLQKPITEFNDMMRALGEDDPSLSATESTSSEESFIISRPYASNDEASRKSRIKKKVTTGLLLVCHDYEQGEEARLEEEHSQLQLIIAILEDMLYDETGSLAHIQCYRHKCCLE